MITVRIRDVVFAMLFAANVLHAQVLQPRMPQGSDQWLFSFGLFGALPMGEFREHEDGGGGGDIMVGWQPWRRQPVVLRFQGGGMLYGALGAYGYQDVCDNTGCWTERVRYNARNHSMWLLQGGPELMATDGKWRPFGYMLAGWTFFSSWANHKPDNPSYGTEYSESLFRSRNFSTSYGAGLRRVTTQLGREGGLELSVRFTRNAKAEYLTEQGLTRNPDGSWTVTPRQGAANVLYLQVGWWIGPYINWNER